MDRINTDSYRILIYAQHLSGVGHYVRSFEIAREMAKYHEVFWIEGGKSVPRKPCENLHIISLPGLSRNADGEVSAMTDPDTTEAVLIQRTQLLTEQIEHVRPHALMIEYFPFSKWELAQELMPAISAARNQGALIICSLRDVIKKTRFETGSEQTYATTVCDLINNHFDHVLVHGDISFTQMEHHFAKTEDINCPIHYTGLVSERLSYSVQSRVDIERITEGKSLVLMSCGGGVGGMQLVELVVAAWQLSDISEERMLVICTGLDWPASWVDSLRVNCSEMNIRLLPFRDDFLQWLQAAELSISQAGYNTIANILETQVRALVIPNPAMSDQPFRAQRLAELGLVNLLSPEQLSPEDLAVAINKAIIRLRPKHNKDLNGAVRTREIIETILSGSLS